MDYVKREDQNIIDDENFKVFKYADMHQKAHQSEVPESQHTAISMEQLHQAMQSSMNSTIVHNLQLPLSPRQISTLMLKSNQLGRNLNFNDIPAYLQRNLSSELDLVHNLASDLPQRHDDILNRNMDLTLARSLANELELQNGLVQTLVPNLNEQDLRIGEVQQNLRTEMPSDIGHEIDLSHHLNRHIDQDILAQERRMNMIQCVQDSQMLEQNFSQALDQNLAQRLDQNLAQRIDQNLAQRLDQNLAQRLDQNLAHRLDHNLAQRLDQVIAQRMGQRLATNLLENRIENDNLIPIPFHTIKSEQDDDGYFYDSLTQGISNVNGLTGHIQEHPQSNQNLHQDNQLYSSIYSNQIQNVPALNTLDLYSRPQNYAQNYVANVIRDNPQNLVVHKFDNPTPYAVEVKKARENQNDTKSDSSKNEEPKENLKPTDQNKIYYAEYPNVQFENNEKNENDPSVTNKIYSEELSMDIKGEYACYKCQAIYPSKRALKQHSKSCLDGDEANEKLGKFCCTQCSYRCQSPAILKIHERTHTGEKPFSCTFCDYKSGQKNNVAKHILVHMKEKPFRCQYCNYRCAQKNNLVVHERTHTGYKPFACPFCEYRTVQKPNLVKHMYLHTDQKPFSCDLCSYRCVQKTNLTKHKQRHMNEKESDKTEAKNQIKPYRPRQKSVKCPHCPYKCVQKASLEKHLMFKHSDLEQGLNLMKEDENFEEIQNLSVRKDMYENQCQEKVMEPLQIQS